MENNYIKEQQYLRAKKRVKDIKGFYSHLSMYLVINIFLICLITYGLIEGGYEFSEAITHFGTYSTALFWGIGLAFHWLGVFGFKGVLGKSWEEKKIKELMDEDDRKSEKFLRK